MMDDSNYSDVQYSTLFTELQKWNQINFPTVTLLHLTYLMHAANALHFKSMC